jgi:hypothetical protein
MFSTYGFIRYHIDLNVNYLTSLNKIKPNKLKIIIDYIRVYNIFFIVIYSH